MNTNSNKLIPGIFPFSLQCQRALSLYPRQYGVIAFVGSATSTYTCTDTCVQEYTEDQH